VTARIATALALLVVAAPGTASAAYGPGADLVSLEPTRFEQANDNVQNAVISQDARYAVFQTTARNLFPAGDTDPPAQIRLGGIFRMDLTTRSLDLVAYGDLRTQSNALVARGAQSPSVSADGRFVSFSTSWKLVPADTNNNLDIYLRDMTKPVSSPDAYQLVSAKDGGATPAAYASILSTQGADLTTATSISADGTKVLFRTGVASNLPNVPDATTPTGQKSPSLTTPGGQLFLRDLTAQTTTLVTRSAADGSPAGGIPPAQPFAALSADGTTVAWSGQNASKQTRFLAAETPNDGLFLNYMWRRVADGAASPTRRITGPVDLDDSGCTPALESLYDNRSDSTGSCYGVLQGPEGDLVGGQLQSKAPVLSADGYRVAFLTGILPRGVNGNTQFDLFVTDMHPGVSRKQGTTQLTTHNLSAADGATTNPIQSLAISADGRRLAFVTGRTTFLLPSPRLTDPPLPVPGTEELYVIDFDRSTIQLASRGLDGGGADQGIANTLSMSGDGTKVAFVSGATNLFAGDANTKADAFVVTDAGTGCTAGCAASESSFLDYSWAPPGRGRGRVTKLNVRSSRSRTLVRLEVSVPSPGTVSATARTKQGTIARARARAAHAGTTTLVLRPAKRFVKLIRRHGRIGASVIVRFTPRNPGPSLSAKHRVTFRR
jgi:Tol biopolymer transport system component